MAKTMVSDPLEADSSDWPALRRTGVLTTFVDKHVQFIRMADRRAQVMITINAFLIPLVASQLRSEVKEFTIMFFMGSALVSIYAAVISLLPKHYGSSPYKNFEMFHFTGIQKFSEEEYMERMRKLFHDDAGLMPYVAFDLYHMSTCILKPKFFWLRVSYFTFLFGLSISLILFCFVD